MYIKQLQFVPLIKTYIYIHSHILLYNVIFYRYLDATMILFVKKKAVRIFPAFIAHQFKKEGLHSMNNKFIRQAWIRMICPFFFFKLKTIPKWVLAVLKPLQLIDDSTSSCFVIGGRVEVLHLTIFECHPWWSTTSEFLMPIHNKIYISLVKR